MGGTVSPRSRYRHQILAALAYHGIAPHQGIDPHRVYELLKSLYSFEIRGLRARHLEKVRLLGPQSIAHYRGALAELRERYAVLSIPAHHWVERQENDRPPERGFER